MQAFAPPQSARLRQVTESTTMMGIYAHHVNEPIGTPIRTYRASGLDTNRLLLKTMALEFSIPPNRVAPTIIASFSYG